MIKEKHREKKKSSNGNGPTSGNGGSSGGSGSESNNVGIKPEPMDRDRDIDRGEAEVKDEPPTLSEESHSGEKSGASSPVVDAKSSVTTNPTTTDLCLPESKPEEGPLLDNPVTCKGLKNEDGGSAESEFHGDPCEGVLPLGLSLGSSGPCPSDPLLDGVQPLASNVINKQPGTMEAQYMQQQSQIFVFSTTLANKSAESVIQGQYSSIIAYHCAQPRTKKYLEKHPLKMNQFNRQNPAQWLNNLAQMKQKSGPGVMKCLGMGRGSMKNNIMMDTGLGMGMGQARLPMWNHQGGNGTGNSMQPCLVSQPGVMKPGNMDNSSGMLPDSPNSNPLLQGGIMPSLADFPSDPLSLGSNHSLAGVKVPDENLTPQQRQHREEQLATLRKMQQMLFPEHHSPGDNPLPQSEATPTNPSPTDLEEVLPLPADAAEMMLSHHKNQPGMVAQSEWQKLQFQFYEERKKKGNCASSVPTTSCSTNNSSRGQGPPPPYHQATRSASVPIAMPSPNPSSPNNTTSNLSLPSPRTCSGLNSPAEGKPGRHQSSGPGPSPTGAHNSSIGSPGAGNSSRSLVPSNPGTPVSTHLSPKKEKQNSNTALPSEFSPTSNISAPLSQHSPVDGMFCRSLQSLVQQKQQNNPGNKEPNLMPVPSPQQIQYLNTFEGQELTIQKQPNTSLKETNILSPLPSSSLEGVLPTSSSDLQTKVSGPATPLTPTSVDMGVNRYSGAGTPGEFNNPSPQPVQEKSQSRLISSSNKTDQRFPCTSPQMSDAVATSRFNMMSSSPVVSNSFVQQPSKSGSHFMDVTSPNKSCVGEPGKDQSGSGYPCIGPDNIPLNPNGMTRMGVGNGSKVSHFDPITSLAQMSQQLSNNVANSPVTQPGGMLGPGSGMHPGMMQFNSTGSNNMHLMQMNDLGVCSGPVGLGGGHDSVPGSNMGIRMGNPQMANHSHVFSPGSVGNGSGIGRVGPCQSNNPSISPKPNIMQGPYPSNQGQMQQRMMGRAPVATSYNGANIQVKPSAPNTIQYLPTRPQSGSAGPRGPPSLDFLRFSSPLSNLETKVPTHNLQYFPNNYQQNSIGGNDMLGNVNCGGMGQGVGMNPGNMMIRGNVRGGSGGMMRVGVPPPMGNVGFPNNDQMFPNPGGNPCQMFVPGPKGSPMGLGVAPDASQPLPPSMGQSNNFKNSSFIGPITADPNYAQQFHNFQQQLYATNTKSQLNSQGMGGGQQFFAHK